MRSRAILSSLVSAVLVFGQVQAVSANNDLIKALGAAAAIGLISSQSNQSRAGNTQTNRSTQRAYDPARQERFNVQTALNYFDYPAGTPDGVYGKRTRSAVSALQESLGFPVTGTLTPVQQSFLLKAHERAELGGETTVQTIAALPSGKRGLLQQYHEQETGATLVQLATLNQAQEAELEALREDYEDVQQQLALLRAIEQHQLKGE